MGDRTTTVTRVSISDLKRVKELLLSRSSKAELTGIDFNGDGSVSLTQHEVNWGGEYDADLMAGEGIPFIIHHLDGVSYPEGYITFDGVRRQSAELSNGRMMVLYDEQKNAPDEESIREVRGFCNLQRSTEEQMSNRARPMVQLKRDLERS